MLCVIMLYIYIYILKTCQSLYPIHYVSYLLFPHTKVLFMGRYLLLSGFALKMTMVILIFIFNIEKKYYQFFVCLIEAKVRLKVYIKCIIKVYEYNYM